MLTNATDSQMRICNVCQLLDGDKRKKWCTYCTRCKSWLCEKDVHNYIRRGMAMMKQAFG